MKIKWLGHASFLITSDSGTRVVTDPYIAGDALKYDDITESADIVTVSHEHFDHNNVAAVGGNPAVVKDPAPREIGGVKLRGVPTYHDTSQGKERGSSIIFTMDIDGVKVCHAGDLGHPLGAAEVSAVGALDVLLIPVGGFFTVDAKVATDVVNQLDPKVVIPMHFKNDRCDLPINGVDGFLAAKQGVKTADSSEAEFKAGQLPAATEILVLQPQC